MTISFLPNSNLRTKRLVSMLCLLSGVEAPPIDPTSVISGKKATPLYVGLLDCRHRSSVRLKSQPPVEREPSPKQTKAVSCFPLGTTPKISKSFLHPDGRRPHAVAVAIPLILNDGVLPTAWPNLYAKKLSKVMVFRLRSPV